MPPPSPIFKFTTADRNTWEIVERIWREQHAMPVSEWVSHVKVWSDNWSRVDKARAFLTSEVSPVHPQDVGVVGGTMTFWYVWSDPQAQNDFMNDLRGMVPLEYEVKTEPSLR